jgi:hypothetical protein
MAVDEPVKISGCLFVQLLNNKHTNADKTKVFIVKNLA